MKNHIHIDIETYSDVDIKNGVPRYAASPNAEILMIAAAVGDMPVRITDDPDSELWDKIRTVIENPKYVKVAHNAKFEMELLEKVGGMKINPFSWECTMVMAQSLSFPGRLKQLVPALSLPEKYHKKEGMKYINMFSVPQKPTKANGGITRYTKDTHPIEWQEFMEYCVQDVEAERAAYDHMSEMLRSR